MQWLFSNQNNEAIEILGDNIFSLLYNDLVDKQKLRDIVKKTIINFLYYEKIDIQKLKQRLEIIEKLPQDKRLLHQLSYEELIKLKPQEDLYHSLLYSGVATENDIDSNLSLLVMQLDEQKYKQLQDYINNNKRQIKQIKEREEELKNIRHSNLAKINIPKIEGLFKEDLKPKKIIVTKKIQISEEFMNKLAKIYSS